MHETDRKVPVHRPRAVITLGIFLFLCGGIIVYGSMTILQSIRSPFLQQGAQQTVLGAQRVGLQQDVSLLKTTDTDGDGITDYDEVYTYKTSMYLKDTDSDGFEDKQEILSQNDPNCPKDKNCFNPLAGTRTLSGQGSMEDLLFGSSNASGLDGQVEQLRKATPAQVRDMLRAKGLSEEKLNSMQDSDLMDLYLKGLEKALAESSGTPSQEIPPSAYQDPTQLTPAQIRTLMMQSGEVTAEQLSTIDDATLKGMYLKIVTDIQSRQRPDGTFAP